MLASELRERAGRSGDDLMKMVAPFAIALAATALGLGSAAVWGIRAPATPSPSIVATSHTAPQSLADAAWAETKWPFLLDQWGIGKAFTCTPADCGIKIDVVIRPKIGFCNCSTGVSDDTELERVADTDLISPKTQPLGPSHPVKVGWMRGLGRAYAADEKAGERLLSIAFSDECDVVVATARLGHGDPAVIEPAVLAFLNSKPMVLWTKKELGLEYVRRDW
jgi:hypothetical protein